MKRRTFLSATAALGLGALATTRVSGASTRLNVLWIVVEDISPHLGCYGEPGVNTPNLDLLAREGVRFENAFVSCPVCSPARSALVTGMYQSTLGSHNHRSQRTDERDGGDPSFHDSYHLPESLPLISDVFRNAGYHVCNGRDVTGHRPGKQDYNFATRHEPFDGSDWRDTPQGKPFFAQVQLAGGKARGPEYFVDEFTLPPYYPDDELIRRDWGEYLGSVERLDDEVGQIVQQLKDAGVYDTTLLVVLTDHGVSHARGKQFLYEEGMRIPMIIRFPGGRHAGTVRRDLALHIDVGPSSLAVAGIAVPDHVQGNNLFADGYADRSFVVSGRDRCDETVDTMRCVRTDRYKYIRNFQSFRSHMQHNQYKDNKDIVQRLRRLHEEGRLTPLQDRIFAPTRPTEELYDVVSDPHETNNLAGQPEHRELLDRLRGQLYDWMVETGDSGLFPEPLLEDMGRTHGSKYNAMQQVGKEKLPALIQTIEAGERADAVALTEAAQSACPATRYWAATWLGNLEEETAVETLASLADDDTPMVRLAAHLALCKLGRAEHHLPQLAALLDDPNRILGMYAMDAIDQTGILDETVRKTADKALTAAFEPTQRYGRRLTARLEDASAV